MENKFTIREFRQKVSFTPEGVAVPGGVSKYGSVQVYDDAGNEITSSTAELPATTEEFQAFLSEGNVALQGEYDKMNSTFEELRTKAQAAEARALQAEAKLAIVQKGMLFIAEELNKV